MRVSQQRTPESCHDFRVCRSFETLSCDPPHPGLPKGIGGHQITSLKANCYQALDSFYRDLVLMSTQVR